MESLLSDAGRTGTIEVTGDGECTYICASGSVEVKTPEFIHILTKDTHASDAALYTALGGT
jgi:hypothetical protein